MAPKPMTAADALAWLTRCLHTGKVKPDEPTAIFVGHDYAAAGAATAWAVAARAIGVPLDRCDRMMATAHAMREWPEHHVPGCGEGSDWHGRKPQQRKEGHAS